MTFWMPDQGRTGLPYAPISLDHIYRETEGNQDIFLLVYPPGPLDATRRGLHWSLSWPVYSRNGDEGWRHLHVVTERVRELCEDGSQQFNPRYVFWGAMTKLSESSTVEAAKVLLGTMSLAQRRQIEALAAAVPVARPNGQWNCQDWIVAFLTTMVGDRLITQEKIDALIMTAREAFGDLLPA